MSDSTVPLANIHQSAIINAFYADDYPQVIHLCSEILSAEPENGFAQSYLAKVDEALDEGRGVPLDLRRRFHHANRLAQLQQYAEARTLYEQIIREAQALGIPRWGQAEAALLRMDSYEAVRPLIAQAEDCLAQDDWEEALTLYQQTLAIVPDFASIAAKCERTSRIIDETHRLAALMQSPVILRQEFVAQLLEAIPQIHLLSIQQPESARVQELITAIEKALLEITARLCVEISECLESARRFDHPRVAAALLRRARVLLSYAKNLPIEETALEPLTIEVNKLEVQIATTREFERQLLTYVTGTGTSVDIDLTANAEWSTILVGASGAMRRMRYTWQNARILNRELDVCRMALTCENIEEISAIPTAMTNAPSSDILWWPSWQQARSMLVEISQALSLWQITRNSDVMRHIYTLLAHMQELAHGLIYPLSVVLQGISQHWAAVITQYTESDIPEFFAQPVESYNQG